MKKLLTRTTRFCTACNASTIWELRGEKYVCIGDDAKHPERKVHGCGHEVLVTDLFRVKNV